MQTFLTRVLSAVVLLAVAPHFARAEAPWQKMSLFKKIDCDPTKDYVLTESQGPWLIMAVTFTGEKAEDQARELVLELRRDFKVPAYMHRVHFDYNDGTTEQGGERFGGATKMRYRVNERTEVAVLVGDFPLADDPQAKKTLEEIKFAEPGCLDVERLEKEGRKSSRPLAGWRWMQQTLLPSGDKDKQKGPMGHAFMSANPLIPKDYFVNRGLDPLVVQMNSQVTHSLLTCPGRYTVKVATFTGSIVVDQKRIRDLEDGRVNLKSKLAQAAEQAHLLTEALRAKGYEAFEFHDETSSIVTVGSFDSVGTPRPDGKTEINPEIHTLMDTFGAPKTIPPGGGAPEVGQPRMLVGIPFDVQPMPVHVPRQSVASAYTARTE